MEQTSGQIFCFWENLEAFEKNSPLYHSCIHYWIPIRSYVSCAHFRMTMNSAALGPFPVMVKQARDIWFSSDRGVLTLAYVKTQCGQLKSSHFLHAHLKYCMHAVHITLIICLLSLFIPKPYSFRKILTNEPYFNSSSIKVVKSPLVISIAMYPKSRLGLQRHTRLLLGKF